MKLMHEFEHNDRAMRMYLASYAAKGKTARVPAIQVTSLDPEMGLMEVPYGRLTLNLADGPQLGAWGIHVKTWSENEGLARMSMATGIFSELDMPASAAHAQAATWSIRPERIRLDALDFAIEELGVMPSRRQVLTVLVRESEKVCAPGGVRIIGPGAEPGQPPTICLALDPLGRIVSAEPGHLPIDDAALDRGLLACTVFGSLYQLTGDPIEDTPVLKQMVSSAAAHLQRLRLQPEGFRDTHEHFDRARG